jgi:CYTH domain-containing protein/thymidylate kinase
MKKDIKQIVLTGGPCAGKTTALVRINEYLSNLGYKVFTVPEIPTLITASGWSYLTSNPRLYYEGEKIILELQLEMEDKMRRLAETCTKPCVIVCDRGALDISAYISAEMYDELCANCNTNAEELRHGGRYDAVLHLVSAADGAESFYTTANNASRYEKADEEGLKMARELDKKVIQAWTGHPHLRVIDNSKDFEQKLNRVLYEINSVLGLPQAIVEERKYIVELIGEIPSDSVKSYIQQTYLSSEPGSEVRIRRRTTGHHTINVHTTRRRISSTEEIVTERQVTNALYESLLQQADPYRLTISKRRNSFIYKGQFFELDTYEAPHDDLMILETKGIAAHADLRLPPFLKIVKDITGDTDYYNYNLALRK